MLGTALIPSESIGAARRSIRHATKYLFARPVMLNPHRMTLSPRGSPDIAIVAASLSCSPEAKLNRTQDVFGNFIATGDFKTPTANLTIVSDLVLEHSAAEWPVFQIAPQAHSFPFDYSPVDLIDLGALRIPEHDDQVGRLRTWAQSFVRAKPTDTLSLLQALNSGVLDLVEYRVRTEEGTQSPSETLTLGSGSCRDITALFIDAVRSLGIGARAVSGYLFDPALKIEELSSMHAWAEVYLPGAGWIAFDPTHRRVGGARLVPVAVARNTAQILPVVGSYVGAPSDIVSMDVAIRMTSLL